mmetsp:Transcript_30347/g.68601  ORF Transcript_30347/g.68601 Transcript_30347/m.68601 type:complete len:96 (+) Transcript_30347:31-318(+)|eukprot:753676-Hanusia_phi.AAC.17
MPHHKFGLNRQRESLAMKTANLFWSQPLEGPLVTSRTPVAYVRKRSLSRINVKIYGTFQGKLKTLTNYVATTAIASFVIGKLMNVHAGNDIRPKQ